VIGRIENIGLALWNPKRIAYGVIYYAYEKLRSAGGRRRGKGEQLSQQPRDGRDGRQDYGDGQAMCVRCFYNAVERWCFQFEEKGGKT
jgi:hypothetical protein